MLVIGESLHRQRFKYLWDLLFERHPSGEYFKGKWEGMGKKRPAVPSDELMIEMFRKEPVTLLLDEFQTWFDGLVDSKDEPLKTWAFNFIQILADIAKDHPEALVLVVSVRSGETEAYRQVHRVNPVRIDFKGPSAELDRRRLLLHRLFENRAQVTSAEIARVSGAHIGEYLRLAEVPSADHAKRRDEFLEVWPFAPHLLQLLQDQVLVATSAQETRDLIRILADLFKNRGEASPVLTAADFRLDDEASGIASLLESVANQRHANLREKALRNMSAVRDAVPEADKVAPHLPEIVGALWLRSLAVGNLAGAEPKTLQIDVTRAEPIDGNAFEVEIATIVENSFNIHQTGERLIFREEENAQALLMATAKNDRLFPDGADQRHLAKEIRYVLGGSENAAISRVIVLPKSWEDDPWTPLDEMDRPENWGDQLPIVVLPECPADVEKRLGRWLKDRLAKRRNTVRFLLPRQGSTNAYIDRDLIVVARAVLKANEWRAQSSEFGRLHEKYQRELRGMSKVRYDRFALLKTWNFESPDWCEFHVETLKALGSHIPETIEACVNADLFVAEDFNDAIMAAAKGNETVGKVLGDLMEPRAKGEICIPWLGETIAKEKIVRLCARGKIAINIRNLDFLQANPGEDEETAWRRMRSRPLGTGKHLGETFLLLPGAVPSAGMGAAAPPAPAGQGGLPGIGGVEPGAGGSAGPGGMPRSAPVPSPAGGPVPATITDLSAMPSSPLNLLGKIESWGIGPETRVREVVVKVDATTGATLQKIVKALPDGLSCELNLKKES